MGRYHQQVEPPGGLPPAMDLASLYLNHEGQLFASTEYGISRLTSRGWETIGIDQGLPTNPTCCLLEDQEGSIGVGLDGAGLTRWVGRTNGNPGYGRRVWPGAAFHRDSAGVVWIGTEGGLQRFGQDRKLSPVSTSAQGLGG